jgi:copper chaperone NosL
MKASVFDHDGGQKLRILLLLLALAGIITIASCSSGPDFDEPPDIRYGEDSCERCLMIINEARFAAAYVTDAGEIRRFDDIGGMVAYIDEISEDVAVFWVHDFDTEEWLKAEEAFYVESQQQTPMGFGVIAFADQQRADQWATENEGVMLSFADLFG